MGFLQFTQTTRFLFSNQNELSRLQPVSVPNIGCYTVFGLTRNVVVVIAAVKRSSTLYSVRIVVTSCTKNELIALALSCKWLVYESVFNYYRYYRCDRTIFFSYANNTCVANFIQPARLRVPRPRSSALRRRPVLPAGNEVANHINHVRCQKCWILLCTPVAGEEGSTVVRYATSRIAYISCVLNGSVVYAGEKKYPRVSIADYWLKDSGVQRQCVCFFFIFIITRLNPSKEKN